MEEVAIYATGPAITLTKKKKILATICVGKSIVRSKSAKPQLSRTHFDEIGYKNLRWRNQPA